MGIEADSILQAFFDSYHLAGEILDDDAVGEAWNSPSALGGLTVGGVAAHLYAAMRRFEAALDEEVPPAHRLVTLPEFYGRNRVDRAGALDEGLHPLIRDDAERRASYGARAVAERFDALGQRLEARLPREPMERLVPVWTVDDGATTFASYLVTRVVELLVHGDDLAVSAGLAPIAVPPGAATAVIGAFVDMARQRQGDLAVIRAFARAERADPGTLRVL